MVKYSPALNSQIISEHLIGVTNRTELIVSSRQNLNGM